MWAQCNVHNFVFLCGVCYRPPNQSANEEKAFFESLQVCFDKIKNQILLAIVLLGDFNAHFDYGDTLSPNTDIGIRVFLCGVTCAKILFQILFGRSCIFY